MKLHIDGEEDAWMADHGTTLGAMSSSKLVGIIRIAEFHPSQRDKMEAIVRQDDSELNGIKPMTCAIWVGRACERLRDEGLMQFEDWAAVRREVLDFSNGHWESGFSNKQPRPLGYSRLCGLTS